MHLSILYTQKKKKKKKTKTKERIPIGIYKKSASKPNYPQPRLSMKANNEKFPISNEALDQSKREIMKLSFNL